MRYRTGTTGIKEINTESVFSLYPNPTTGVVNITTNGSVNAIVYNTLGDVVMKTTETNIDLKDLSSGVYFVTVYNNKTSKTIKLVKQ